MAYQFNELQHVVEAVLAMLIRIVVHCVNVVGEVLYDDEHAATTNER